MQMCFDLQEWELLNEHILLLTKKRGQLKTVVYVHSLRMYISQSTGVLYSHGLGSLAIRLAHHSFNVRPIRDFTPSCYSAHQNTLLNKKSCKYMHGKGIWVYQNSSWI